MKNYTFMESNTMKIKGLTDWDTVITELERRGVNYISSDPYTLDGETWHMVMFFSVDKGRLCRELTELIGGQFTRYDNGVKVA